MFAKDFNLLNDIYNKRIFLKENVGLGPEAVGDTSPSQTVKRMILPKARPCPKCNEPNECSCDNQPAEDDIVLADEPVHSGYDDRERSAQYDEEAARMSKQELFRIAKMAYMLHDIISDSDELAPWLADKISRAYEGLNSVFAYKDYEKFREELDSDHHVEEGTERDLFDSIRRAGDGIVGQLRGKLQNESRQTVEKVLLEVISILETKKRK